MRSLYRSLSRCGIPDDGSLPSQLEGEDTVSERMASMLWIPKLRHLQSEVQPSFLLLYGWMVHVRAVALGTSFVTVIQEVIMQSCPRVCRPFLHPEYEYD
jgi:hypothetical protein